MQIESVSYSMSPERVTTDTFDFLWLVLRPRTRTQPLKSVSLQWIDWRLRGRLSRFLRTQPDIGNTPVYFSAPESLASPMVAVISAEVVDWTTLLKVSHGARAKNIGIFFEEASAAESARSSLQKHHSSGLAERVTVAFDASTA